LNGCAATSDAIAPVILTQVPATSLGAPSLVAKAFFFLFLATTLGITWWAARRTRTTEQFYAAGRSITARQNGIALAGDYMSAASFLGIAGLVSLSGFDGLIYSTGWLVGWPVVLCLIAEPLRNLGKYTFADAVTVRLQEKPVRIAAAVAVVGAGMLAYVLFGGMLAASWVQIVKAVLLRSGAAAVALLVLVRFEMSPARLFAEAAARFGDPVLSPGKLVARPLDAISLGLALMFGTAGLPHILMRFYTVPDAKAARVSVFYATGIIGAFYLMTFILGFGAMVLVGPDTIRAVDAGGNMAAPLLAELLGGTAFLGFIGAVAFATILAVVAGLTLSGAAALSHDLWVNVVKSGHADAREQLRVARLATLVLGVVAVLLGILFKGQNVAFMVGLAFAIAASGNFPALILSMFWRGATTAGIVTTMLVGTGATLLLIYLSPTVQVDILRHESAWFPLKNPALVSMPLGFLSGIVVSLLRPEPAAARAFAALERRATLGQAAE